MEKYLNKKDVRMAIHATSCPLQFKECTDPPYNALKHQDGLGVTKEVTVLLDRGIPMLFFNGNIWFTKKIKKKNNVLNILHVFLFYFTYRPV